jgi:hypothetical protein
MKIFTSRWMLLVVANVLAWCVLCFQQMSDAQSKAPQLPFANSNEQRSELVREVRDIKELIKETNALLRDLGAKNAAVGKNAK